MEVKIAEGSSPVTCPLCHTNNSALTMADVTEGATWRCTRCGQMWSAARLSAMAADASIALPRLSVAVEPIQ